MAQMGIEKAKTDLGIPRLAPLRSAQPQKRKRKRSKSGSDSEADEDFLPSGEDSARGEDEYGEQEDEEEEVMETAAAAEEEEEKEEEKARPEKKEERQKKKTPQPKKAKKEIVDTSRGLEPDSATSSRRRARAGPTDLSVVQEAFSLFEGTADEQGSIGIADLMRLGHKHEKPWKREDYVSMIDMFNSASGFSGRKISLADFNALFEEGRLAPVMAKL